MDVEYENIFFNTIDFQLFKMISVLNDIFFDKLLCLGQFQATTYIAWAVVYARLTFKGYFNLKLLRCTEIC